MGCWHHSTPFWYPWQSLALLNYQFHWKFCCCRISDPKKFKDDKIMYQGKYLSLKGQDTANMDASACKQFSHVDSKSSVILLLKIKKK
jgi:hypothetical protein